MDLSHCHLDVSSSEDSNGLFSITLTTRELGVYETKIVFESAYMDATQLVELLRKEKNDFGGGVTANFFISYEPRIAVSGAGTKKREIHAQISVQGTGTNAMDVQHTFTVVLYINIRFQRNSRTREVVENHKYEMSPVTKDAIAGRIEIMEELNRQLIKELASTRKRLKASFSYDSRSRPISYRNLFQVKQSKTDLQYQITVNIASEHKDFLDFVRTHDRFQNLCQTQGWSDLSFTRTVKWTNKETMALEYPYFQEWLLDLRPGHQSFCLLKKTPADVREYLQKTKLLAGDTLSHKVPIDLVLITLFEINLEFELSGFILLPPSLLEPRFQCIPKHGVHNTFQLLEKIKDEITFDSGLSYNPRIGFYTFDLE
jgi:hypothetical protein